MTSLKTATSAYKRKVEAFERASVGKVKDGTDIDSVAGGQQLLRLNLERWNVLEELYTKLCETHPHPDEQVEQVEEDEQDEIPREYAFRDELWDRAQASYDVVNNAISKRIGTLSEPVVDVIPAGRLTDTQSCHAGS